jgi:hypothetical protein
MYISHFRVHNYKSFYKSPSLSLSPGFNIITGQNNAGKTALLQALSLRFAINPHFSLKTVPWKNAPVKTACNIDLSFVVEPSEIKELLSTPGAYFIPWPRFNTELAQAIDCNISNAATASNIFNWFGTISDGLTFNVRLLRDLNRDEWNVASLPSFGRYEVQNASGGQCLFARCDVNADGTIQQHQSTTAPANAEIGTLSFAIIASARSRLTWNGLGTNNRSTCQPFSCLSFDSSDSC